MGNVFTLDAMREDIEREFAPFQIEVEGKTLTLKNLLRVPRRNREEVYSLLDEMAEVQRAAEEEETSGLSSTEKSAQIALSILPLVADKPALAEKLVEEIQEDFALSLRVFSSWMDKTQAGEADRSHS